MKAPLPPRTPEKHFPIAGGIFLGLGLGGFFDGIVLHQILQWHHLASHVYPADSVANLTFNTLLDGLFHAATYVFVVLGLVIFWNSARQGKLLVSTRMLVGSVLKGFGIFNLVEGIINHHILQLHHVNETVPQAQWIYWDVGFLIWGAAMVLVGRYLYQTAKQQTTPGP